jgi:hypothetical protein
MGGSDDNREKHHEAYICTSDLPSKKQDRQQIDRNFHFPFPFDTESEELPFLSHCFQLTAAASDKDTTKQLEDKIRSRPAEVQAQADSAR